MYDLEKRILLFNKQLILYLKSIYINDFNKNIVNQVLRSSTSIGANYCEANGAGSKRDFANKIYICKKESKETVYWLELLLEITTTSREKIETLFQEAHQIACIFNKISQNFKKTNTPTPN